MGVKEKSDCMYIQAILQWGGRSSDNTEQLNHCCDTMTWPGSNVSRGYHDSERGGTCHLTVGEDVNGHQ